MDEPNLNLNLNLNQNEPNQNEPVPFTLEENLELSISDHEELVAARCMVDLILDLDNLTDECLRIFLDGLMERLVMMRDTFEQLNKDLLHPTSTEYMLPNVFILASGVRIRLLITAKDVYFLAFEINGVIYEGAPKPGQKIINNSIWLTFGMNYPNLSDSLSFFAIPIGLLPLRHAMHTFIARAEINNANDVSPDLIDALKRAVGMVCFVILEPLRSVALRLFLTDQVPYWSTQPFPNLHKTVHRWSYQQTLYSFARLCYQTPDDPTCRNGIDTILPVIADLNVSRIPNPLIRLENFENQLGNIVRKINMVNADE